MLVVFQNEFIPVDQFQVDFKDRGFIYGDGFFETFFISKGIIPHFDIRCERIENAMNVFGFENLPFGNYSILEHQLLELVEKNYQETARVKLILWRNEGGFFSPSSNQCKYFIQTTPLSPSSDYKENVSILLTPLLLETPFSKFKSISSYQYIYAGQQLKQTQADDIIILDYDSNVAECLHSNLFWKKDAKYYTPSLKTGCIDGIMRKKIIMFLSNLGHTILESKHKVQELLEADSVFICNSNSIQEIKKIEHQSFKTDETVNYLRYELLTKYL